MTQPLTHVSADRAWRARRARIAYTILTPPSRLTLAQWADRYRVLSRDLGEPGPWRTSRVEYLREPMEAISDPRVREVVIQKSARIGATQALVVNSVGYYVHQEPTSVIVAVPTEADAKKFSKTLLGPAITDTPALAALVAEDKARDKSNTLTAKSHPGGTIHILGTTSPRNLRMVHGRIVLMSEVDSYDGSSGAEGDPVDLLRKRADSYGSPKFVLESTPLLKGASRIERAYQLSDQRRFHVTCPHCGAEQVLKWGGRDLPYGIKWTDSDPDTAYYLCEANACVIEESSKYAMVANGRWVPTSPGSPVRGYHLNALVSPFDGARWPVLVRAWLEAQGNPSALQVFVNTALGETYEDEGSKLDASQLAERLERFPVAEDGETTLVPARVGVLVRVVDTQDDRLETAVWGFGEGEEAWRVDFEVFPGSTSVPLGAPHSPWNDLKARLRHAYVHESGPRMVPQVTFVDSGGHATAAVYTFTKAHQHLNCYAIKGANTEGHPLLGKPTRNNSARAILYMVGSFAAKEQALKRFASIATPGPGFIHLGEDCDGQQLEQFTNEKLVTRFVAGKPKREWLKTGSCEQFHLLAYAYCALEKLGHATKRQLGAMARQVAASAAPGRRTEPPGSPTADGQPTVPPRPPGTGGFIHRWR